MKAKYKVVYTFTLMSIFISSCSSSVSGHNLLHRNPISSTCTESGVAEHWECLDCGKLFSDKEGKNEITSTDAPLKNHSLTYVSALPATETTKGFMEHYRCSECKGYFVLENGVYTKKTYNDLVIDYSRNYTVTFNFDGYKPVYVRGGSKVAKPANPVKPATSAYSYTFVEWQLNGHTYNFDSVVTKDIILNPYFKQTPVNYTITFKCEGKADVIKTFNCETNQETFEEPKLDTRPGFSASWSKYDLSKLVNQTSTAIYTDDGTTLSKVSIQKHEGYTIKFHIVEHATTYEIKDDNDYRSSVVLKASDADKDGYLYYTTEVVGKHNVTVTAKATGYVSSESNIYKCVENEPVFVYSPFSSVMFYDNRANPQASTYSLKLKDGSWKYVTQSEFNSTYIRDQGDILDYTVEPYITNILTMLKDSGSNVVNLGNRLTNIENFNAWWWGTSFETSSLKRVMDAAWKLGMKCLITDFQLLNNSCKADVEATMMERITSTGMKAAIKHPAFYGIELEDEPMPGDEIVNIGKNIKAILSAWHSDSYLKTLPDPIFHTDLCSFNTNENTSGGDPYLFPTAQDYQNYLESWILNTGLNYIYFDYYTYTTYIYGQKSYLSKQYYYDSSKVIFDAVNALKSSHPGLVVHQTIVSSNYTKRLDVKSTDVFASTLLSLSQGMYGYSTYTFFPSNSTQENQQVDINLNKTETYTWVDKANEMYVYVKGLLDGYSLLSNEMSTYKQKVGYKDEGIGYGFGLRTSTSTFKNSAGKQLKMVVNYNTYTTNTPTEITIPNGKAYYYLGYGKDMSRKISSGIDVKLNNGEAVLFEL